MWLAFAFLSASLLGLYDVAKKSSLNNNAVIPVLFLNILFSCMIMMPLIISSFLDINQSTIFYLPPFDWKQQPYLILKAVIVLSSWLFAYFSLKHLPITLAGPLKATQPIITLIGAIVVFSERLNVWQWSGVFVAFISLYLLSRSGKKEGINFSHNKWIVFMVLAVILGAISGLYDKFLIRRLDRMTVQVWYNIYQLIIMGIILLGLWLPQKKTTTPFKWKWSIPIISIFLVSADFVYFYALSLPDSMISVVSLVRRSGVVVSFLFGAFIFKEHNLKTKLLDLFLVLIGMLLIYIGSR